MITSLNIASIDGHSFDFLASPHVLRVWEPEYEVRGEDRNKGGAHGAWGRYTYRGKQVIGQEGILVGVSGSAVMAARESMLTAIYGSATILAPTSQALGTLAVTYANWAGSAVAAVTVESVTANPSYNDPRTIPYRIVWVAFTDFQRAGTAVLT